MTIQQEDVIRMAQQAGVSNQFFFSELTDLYVRFAELVAAHERERICVAIKAEDDYCMTGGYMLDSEDYIRIARGEWKRPEFL